DLLVPACVHHWSAHRGSRAGKAIADGVALHPVRGGRRAADLWAEPSRLLPTLWRVCREDPRRGEASRVACRTAREVRARDQREDGEGARPHNPTVIVATSRSNHPVSRQRGTDQPEQLSLSTQSAPDHASASNPPEQVANAYIARRAKPSVVRGHVRLTRWTFPANSPNASVLGRSGSGTPRAWCWMC